MLSPFIKREIFKEAKRCHYQVPSDYEKILEKAQKVNAISDDKIVFSHLYDLWGSSLNANAGILHLILCNTKWAIRLVFFNNEDTMNAFFITIGHELTHKEKDFLCFSLNPKDYKFMFRVGEVHADYGAAEKMVHSSRRKLLESVRYKKALKKIDKEDFMHPTWNKREYYIEHFDFDEKLIRQIATDVGCSNSKLIQKVCNYYKRIVLK